MRLPIRIQRRRTRASLPQPGTARERGRLRCGYCLGGCVWCWWGRVGAVGVA